MDLRNDVIVALATPPGRGGVSVIRVSGPDLSALAEGFTGCAVCLKPRVAHFLSFLARDGSVIDQGLVIRFPAPDSFTGENVIELHGHGGMVVVDMLLERAIELGARYAGPGEFSERAFLNGKLDLVQAEAIADLISSASRMAARSAVKSLQGVFSSEVEHIATQIYQLRARIEAELDFSEEEIDLLSPEQINSRIGKIQSALDELAVQANQGRVLNEGFTVVMAGRPNAGKSSLLNYLSGIETAIVTDVPGTTRDVLREKILVDGLPVHIVDTAGLRDSEDQIEREGVRRAHQEISSADQIFLLIDATDQHQLNELADGLPAYLGSLGLSQQNLPAVSVILNKCDLSGTAAGERDGSDVPTFALSAKTGAGIDALRMHILACAGFDAGNDGGFLARRRHLEAIQACRDHLETAMLCSQRTAQSDLVAEEMRLAHDHLGQITGKVHADDLLGKIFGEFCIGK